ncbi:hypothetical protein AVEN_122680-1 [Araneus ventricosus]|uniref:Uncharacterized protein n=1 Tax=Araneus ventricosus TaxID=182803 RepID=A0A4Y2PC00_ARAVE|nr:hypothetical protein AVEN_122680-1 [Araneus ventricosus]
MKLALGPYPRGNPGYLMIPTLHRRWLSRSNLEPNRLSNLIVLKFLEPVLVPIGPITATTSYFHETNMTSNDSRGETGPTPVFTPLI